MNNKKLYNDLDNLCVEFNSILYDDLFLNIEYTLRYKIRRDLNAGLIWELNNELNNELEFELLNYE